MNDLPGYVWAVVLTGVVGLPATTIVMLYRGALATASRRAGTIAAVAAITWIGWLVAAFALIRAGAYQQQGTAANPAIAVTFVAVAALTLLAARIPIAARLLADPGTPARLALPQTFRIAGGVFLIVLGLGQLPAIFAIPAGLGDVAIGVAAPFVARRLSRGGARPAAVWFNVLGIVDLVVAVGIGYLAGLGPTNLLHVTPTIQAVSMLPLALIPTTAVPLAVVLHVVSLHRLRFATRPGTTTARVARVAG